MKDRHGDQMPRMPSFITGTGRTGDIERILVLGPTALRNATSSSWAESFHR